MANKIYHISIQSVFFTTTLTAEEGSTFRAMKYNPGVIVECTEPNGKKTYSFHDQFVRTPQVDSLEELMNELETHLLVPGVLTLRREIDTITSGMYPVGYLWYKSNFEPNYPRSIVCYLDFADLTANISVELLDQL